VAGPAVLAACGGDDDGGTGATPSGSGSAGELALWAFFQDGVQVAGRQRFAVGLGDAAEIWGADRAPDELTVRIERDGQAVGQPLTLSRHGKGLERAYYPLRTELTEPGVYRAVADVDGEAAALAFTVAERGQVDVPGAGDAMVPVDTPTTADAHGVDPICTREPHCPYHDVTLTEALADGRPVALVVATPAFCATAVCGPILDIVDTASEGLRDRIHVLHAEVYADGAGGTPAPVMEAYGLTYEPCLFLADGRGTVVERLDVLFDETEARQALERLAALS